MILFKLVTHISINYLKTTDIIILLVNTDRGSQNNLAENFKDADFIVASGSTNLTRTNAPQKDNGPYVFSCGKQGKYLLTLDAN